MIDCQVVSEPYFFRVHIVDNQFGQNGEVNWRSKLPKSLMNHCCHCCCPEWHWNWTAIEFIETHSTLSLLFWFFAPFHLPTPRMVKPVKISIVYVRNTWLEHGKFHLHGWTTHPGVQGPLHYTCSTGTIPLDFGTEGKEEVAKKSQKIDSDIRQI